MNPAKNNPFSPLLGAHTSIAGGVFNAIKIGEEIGAEVVQIFSKNQRQWGGRPYSEEELETYFRLREETGIQPVMVHDTYLINLASPEPETLNKSLAAFIDEIQRTSTLKIPYLVAHPGSHAGAGEKTGVRRVAESLRRCWESAAAPGVIILLETTAGQGSNLGYTFAQLRDMIALSGIEAHLGVCIDTCHIFAAGYDIRSAEGWEKTVQEFRPAKAESLPFQRFTARAWQPQRPPRAHRQGRNWGGGVPADPERRAGQPSTHDIGNSRRERRRQSGFGFIARDGGEGKVIHEIVTINNCQLAIANWQLAIIKTSGPSNR